MADVTLTPRCELFIPINQPTPSPGPFRFNIPFNYSQVSLNPAIAGASCSVLYQLQADGETIPAAAPVASFASGPTVGFNSHNGSGMIGGTIQVTALDPRAAALVIDVQLPLALTINANSSSFQVQHYRVIPNPQQFDSVPVNVRSSHSNPSDAASLIGQPMNFPAYQNATATVGIPSATVPVGPPPHHVRHLDVTVSVPININPSNVPNNGNPTYLAVVFALNIAFGPAMQFHPKPVE